MPRVALLGAGPHELELLTELHAGRRVELAGVYDADPQAPGLALAEVLGVAAGNSAEFLATLHDVEFRILPHDPRSASRLDPGSAALTVDEARARWAGAPPVEHPESAAVAERLESLVEASAALGQRAEFADWLLGVALRAVGANGGSIQRLATETGELYVLAAHGLSERLVRLGRHRVGVGVSGTVAATRAPQVVLGDKPGRLARERGTIAAAVSVPLEDASGLYGVLNVSSTIPGRSFGDEHVRALQRLAPKIVALLRSAETPAGPTPGVAALAQEVRALDREPVAVRERLQRLVDFVRRRVGAEQATLCLATEDADWVVACETGERLPGTGPQRARLARALVEDVWVHAAESDDDPAIDPIDARLDTADGGAVSRVYAPLGGVHPVGVLALGFRSLAESDAAVREHRGLVEQLGFEVDAAVRAQLQEQRVARLARVARQPADWPAEPGALLATLAAQAAALAGARAAFVRRTDERARTYSRPAVHGVPETALADWRRFDAEITERTLQSRQAAIATASQPETAALETAVTRRSLLSVPIIDRDRIVGVLNVYDKLPVEPLEPPVFTRVEREALEALAALAAPRLAGDAGSGGTETTIASRAEPRDDPAAGGDIGALVRQALLEAAAAEREVGIWVVRLAGASRLAPEELEALHTDVQARTRRCLRGSDACDWTGAEDLVVVCPGWSLPPRELDARVAAALGPALARTATRAGIEIALRIGSSAFPRDGQDAQALVETAADRAV